MDGLSERGLGMLTRLDFIKRFTGMIAGGATLAVMPWRWPKGEAATITLPKVDPNPKVYSVAGIGRIPTNGSYPMGNGVVAIWGDNGTPPPIGPDTLSWKMDGKHWFVLENNIG